MPKKQRRNKYLSCARCAGTGRYGDCGVCFQCDGKGYATMHDRIRQARYNARRAVEEKERARDEAYAQHKRETKAETE